ncbi:hypothetical protein [Hymenobacter setariae]|uniref:hypothetical protein n=1 Tax=Hymenobacter setariae TaxID=2594794 RepID=UPI001F462A4C|nr:hypothetical protein [Hymenobacter setariae]
MNEIRTYIGFTGGYGGYASLVLGTSAIERRGAVPVRRVVIKCKRPHHVSNA